MAECVREGRVARGGAVLTVGVDAARVEGRLVSGELACPGWGGCLGPWGWARIRVLRGGARRGCCGAVAVAARRCGVAVVVGVGSVGRSSACAWLAGGWAQHQFALTRGQATLTPFAGS